MRRRGRLQQSKVTRAFSLRIEDLEGRQLLSTGLSPITGVVATASPVAIGRVVAAPLSSSGTASTIGPSSSGTITPLATGTTAAPYSPSIIRHAYGVDQLSYDGTGQTIAIIDAYADTTIQADLAAFDTQFGLPAPPKLTVVTPPNQNNGVAPADPSGPTGWPLETALDVEWAHSIAPGANILLVEAASSSYTNLLGAVTYAVGQGANEVSMSWGGSDSGSDSSYDSTFSGHSGVSFFASSGDSGLGVEYPAASPYVTAVGGTTLNLDGSGNRTTETGWSGSGGGYSADETRPTYQNGFVTATQVVKGVTTTERGVPDVSYDADPNTGVYVDDNSTWYQVGGTSAGSPQWAALMALANQGRAANNLSPVGAGVTGGTNAVLYGLAGGTSYTDAGGDFTDITSGSNGTNSNAAVGWDPVTGLGSPVANKLIPDLVGKPIAPTAPTVGDASFETVSVGSGTFGSYSYDPTGSAWTFSSSSGVAGNGSGFTAGNPSAPQGSQVAFLQQQGSFTQSITNWAAGTYQITFTAAQRGNIFGQNENFEVLIDGNVVSTFDPTSTSYLTETTASFAVTAGSHSITFKGLDSAGGDNSALIDTVAVAVVVPVTPPTVATVGDASFETVSVGSGTFGAYAYDPTGSAWTFSGGSGVAGNGSGFTAGNPSAPQGSQVAFLQQQGSFTQSIVNWAAGNYQVSFAAAQRGNIFGQNENFEILIDGTVVSTFDPTSTSYLTYTTASFAVTAGTHSITFKGLDSAGGDNSALIDTVALNQD